MFCAISGESPKEAVVTKSGIVFEKRLIEKYLADQGKCPVTHEELSVEDLIPLKNSSAAKPKQPSATSIPSLLFTFQSEWDALMLETYSLKQQLEQVKQELSHSLYQQEAAFRIIARLTAERDDAQRALANFEVKYKHVSIPTATATNGKAQDGAHDMDVDTEHVSRSIDDEVIKTISETCDRLLVSRKNRSKPTGLATSDDLKSMKEVESHPGLHSSTAPGISCMDISEDQKTIITGGVDSSILVFDAEEKTILHTLKGHSKKVTDITFLNKDNAQHILSASADKTCKIWSPDGEGFQNSATLKCHKGEVSGLSIHPCNQYVLTSSLDGSWAFSDIGTATVLERNVSSTPSLEYTCCKFHPDGVIFGVGQNDGSISIWDLKTQTVAATFKGHKGKLSALSFSENGYSLASTSEDNCAMIWDLRYLQKSANVISFDDDFNPSNLTFDKSGQYLGIAGKDIRLFSVAKGKKFNLLSTLSDHSASVTSLRFGTAANAVYSVSMDRSLKVYKY